MRPQVSPERLRDGSTLVGQTEREPKTTTPDEKSFVYSLPSIRRFQNNFINRGHQKRPNNTPGLNAEDAPATKILQSSSRFELVQRYTDLFNLQQMRGDSTWIQLH